MAMETHSTKRKRVYQRKFDHDLAREMAEKGFTSAEIRRHLGNTVSVTAIQRVIDPQVRERMEERSRQYLMSAICMNCGGSTARYRSRRSNYQRSGLCRSCWAKSRQTRFIVDDDDQVVSVCCTSCKNWFPAEIFPKNKTGTRGFHNSCKNCGTKKRGEYRNRQKIPCIVCGEPCLPPREKGPRARSVARCVKCFHDLRAGRREALEGEPDFL